MKKFLIPVLAVMMMARVSAYAQSANVNFQGGAGAPNMVDSSNNPLPDGNSVSGLNVSIGYFTAGFNVGANAGNLQALGANWHSFSATNIRTIFGVPGSFSASASSAAPGF